MTKTEACRRVALAALLAGSMAAAQEALAAVGEPKNGLDPYGFADEGTSPNGDSSGGVTIVAVPADPTPPNPDPKRASDLGGVMVAAKPDPSPTPR
jgi:hypothetical protein